MTDQISHFCFFSDAHLVTDEQEARHDCPNWFRMVRSLMEGPVERYMARQFVLRRERLRQAARIAKGRETFFLGDVISDGMDATLREVVDLFPHAHFVIGGHDIGQQDQRPRSPKERRRLMERAIDHLGPPCRVIEKPGVTFLLLCSELLIRKDPALDCFRRDQQNRIARVLSATPRVALVMHDPRALFRIAGLLHRNWRRIVAIFHGHLHFGYSWPGMRLFGIPSLSGHLWDFFTCRVFRPGYAVAQIHARRVQVRRHRLARASL